MPKDNIGNIIRATHCTSWSERALALSRRSKAAYAQIHPGFHHWRTGHYRLLRAGDERSSSRQHEACDTLPWELPELEA